MVSLKVLEKHILMITNMLDFNLPLPMNPDNSPWLKSNGNGMF